MQAFWNSFVWRKHLRFYRLDIIHTKKRMTISTNDNTWWMHDDLPSTHAKDPEDGRSSIGEGHLPAATHSAFLALSASFTYIMCCITIRPKSQVSDASILKVLVRERRSSSGTQRRLDWHSPHWLHRPTRQSDAKHVKNIALANDKQ